MLKVSLPDKGYKARPSQASMLTLYNKLLPLNRTIIQDKPEAVKSNPLYSAFFYLLCGLFIKNPPCHGLDQISIYIIILFHLEDISENSDSLSFFKRDSAVNILILSSGPAASRPAVLKSDQ